MTSSRAETAGSLSWVAKLRAGIYRWTTIGAHDHEKAKARFLKQRGPMSYASHVKEPLTTSTGKKCRRKSDRCPMRRARESVTAVVVIAVVTDKTCG